MKTTQYFQHTRTRPDRALIKGEWITFVVENPIRIEIQSDGRIKNSALGTSFPMVVVGTSMKFRVVMVGQRVM